jgi:hypothetical protein
VARLELKDDLELPAAKCPTEQLMPIAIRLVPANLKVQEEALNRFVERHSMLSEFVALEVVLEIRRRKPMPIDHGLSYAQSRVS